MSKEILKEILDKLGVGLEESDEQELHKELTNAFGIAGAWDECDALDEKWRIEQDKVKEFIINWIKKNKKKQKKMEVVYA